jgi:hypothetical protein
VTPERGFPKGSDFPLNVFCENLRSKQTEAENKINF